MKDLDIQIGDRVTGTDCITKTPRSIIVYDEAVIDNMEELVEKEILKIERIGSNGWYTVYEKKDLLTNEERVFLKYYTKYLKLQEKEEMIRVRKESSEICFSVNDSYRKYLYQKYL